MITQPDRILEIIHTEVNNPTTTQNVIGIASLPYFYMPFDVALYSQKRGNEVVINQQELIKLRESDGYEQFFLDKETMAAEVQKMITNHIQRNPLPMHVSRPSDSRDSGSVYPGEVGNHIKKQARLDMSDIGGLAIRLAYGGPLKIGMWDMVGKR